MNTAFPSVEGDIQVRELFSAGEHDGLLLYSMNTYENTDGRWHNVLSSTPSGLQGALNIVSHYGKRYQLTFNADKTKIVVSGSNVDIQF